MNSTLKNWKNFAYLSLIQMANQLLGFFTVLYLARTLGPEVYGQIAYVLSIIVYLNLLVQYGFDISGPRRAARSSYEELKYLVAEVLAGRFLLLSIALILIFLFFHLFALAQMAHFLLPFFGLVIAQAFSLNWLLLGKGQVANVMLLELGQRVFVLLGLFLWVKSPEGGPTYAFISGIGALLASAMGWLLALRLLNFQLPLPRLTLGFRALREGAWLFLSQGALVWLSGGNNFLVGVLAGTQAVAPYAVAEKLILSLYSFLQPVFRFYFSQMSSAIDRKAFLHIGRQALGVFLFLGGGLALTLALSSPLLIVSLFGPAYEKAIWIARVLSLWLLLSALSLVWGHLALVSLRYDRTHTLLLLGQVGVQILLASFLVPRWEGLGMALALVASAGLLTLAQGFLLRFRVKISPLFLEEP